jgi:ATP-dependent protease ClpP protease subunit
LNFKKKQMKHETKTLQYADNFSSSDERVTMLLYGAIGTDNYDEKGNRLINGYEFASEMFYLHNCGYKIDVRINSPGGNIQGGFAILDAVIQTKANTIAAGMAASMAGGILQGGVVRKMTDFASIMIHGVGGTKDNALKTMLTAQLSDILSKKTKLSPEQISGIMSDGKDHWFALKGVQKDRHAFDLGLVDEIIATEEDFSPEILEESFNEANLLIAYNKILIPEMEKFETVKKALNLSADATESDVLASVETLSNIKAENARVKAENEKLKTDLDSFVEGRAQKIVDGAKAKGYPEANASSLLAFAKADPEAAEQLVNAFSVVPVATPEPAKPAPVATMLVVEPTAPSNGLKTYAEYMSTAQGENEFYTLTSEEQDKVLKSVNA